MIYLQPHRRPYHRTKRIITTIGVSVVLMCIIIVIFVPHIFGAIFTSIAHPFWNISFSIDSGSLLTPAALLSQNENLKQQIDRMQVQIDTISFVEQENQQIKNLLGRNTISTTTKYSRNTKSILAAVLSRPPISPYDEIIIDIGSDHGVSTSSLVYADDSILIGRVVDVFKYTSKVRLYSSPGEKREVLIGTHNIPATAIGRGGGQYEAQISRELSINQGDFVVNPGIDVLPFGIVSAVVSDTTQPFVTVLFAPPVNLYQLKWVLIRI